MNIILDSTASCLVLEVIQHQAVMLMGVISHSVLRKSTLSYTCQWPYLSVLREVVIAIVALTSLLAPIVAQAGPSLADFVIDVENPSQAAALEYVD